MSLDIQSKSQNVEKVYHETLHTFMSHVLRLRPYCEVIQAILQENLWQASLIILQCFMHKEFYTNNINKNYSSCKNSQVNFISKKQQIFSILRSYLLRCLWLQFYQLLDQHEDTEPLL